MHSSVDTADPVLITAILGGEQDRFEELVKRYQRMVYGVAWSQLGNSDLAEEAAQQTFVQAYCYLATLRDPTKFRSWLARIAQNVSISLSRKHRKEFSNSERWRLETADPDQDGTEDRPNLSDELRETLTQIKGMHREILTLFYLEGQSVTEVATTLSLSESAVKTRLNRARNTLRDELEKRLAVALADLNPSHNFMPLVMSAVPSSVPVGSAAKIALLGKTSGALLKAGSLVWLNLISFLPLWAIVYSHSKEQAENYHDGKEHDFRRKITLQHPRNLLLLILIIIPTTAIISQKFGLQTLFRIIGIGCLIALWQAVRLLRANNTPYAVANVLCLAFQAVAGILIGFFEFHVGTFFGAMLLANLFLYRARDSMPARMDYNLFLRAATDGLPISGGAVRPAEDFSTTQLEQFAKFLGRQWLVRDYVIMNDRLQMFLAVANPNILSAPFSQRGSLSWISIDCDGTCHAFAAVRDVLGIETLTQVKIDPAELSMSVRAAVMQSLTHFVSGDLDQARTAICSVDDLQVFKEAPGKTRSTRLVFGLAIGSGVIAVLAFALSHFMASQAHDKRPSVHPPSAPVAVKTELPDS